MKITIDTDNLETLKYKTEDVPILMKTFQQLINKLMYEVIGNYYSVDNVPEDTPKWVKEELLNVGKTCYMDGHINKCKISVAEGAYLASNQKACVGLIPTSCTMIKL